MTHKTAISEAFVDKIIDSGLPFEDLYATLIHARCHGSCDGTTQTVEIHNSNWFLIYAVHSKLLVLLDLVESETVAKIKALFMVSTLDAQGLPHTEIRILKTIRGIQ